MTNIVCYFIFLSSSSSFKTEMCSLKDTLSNVAKLLEFFAGVIFRAEIVKGLFLRNLITQIINKQISAATQRSQ